MDQPQQGHQNDQTAHSQNPFPIAPWTFVNSPLRKRRTILELSPGQLPPDRVRTKAVRPRGGNQWHIVLNTASGIAGRRNPQPAGGRFSRESLVFHLIHQCFGGRGQLGIHTEPRLFSKCPGLEIKGNDVNIPLVDSGELSDEHGIRDFRRFAE